MKNKIFIIFFILSVAACINTEPVKQEESVHQPRYSEQDLFSAEIERDRLCKLSKDEWRRHSEMLDRLNASLAKDVSNRNPSSVETDSIVKELKTLSETVNLEMLEEDCATANEKVHRIVVVRADYFERLDKIKRESRPINCITNKIGSTYHTSCN